MRSDVRPGCTNPHRPGWVWGRDRGREAITRYCPLDRSQHPQPRMRVWSTESTTTTRRTNAVSADMPSRAETRGIHAGADVVSLSHVWGSTRPSCFGLGRVKAGGLQTRQTSHRGGWRASGQAGLGWLEFLPGLPARGALPRQDIPRWEGVCKCVLTTLATNVHPSMRRMICRWQSPGEGNGAIIVHLACPDLLSPQETRRRDVVNLRPIPPPPTSAGLGGSGWTKTKATLPRLGQVAGVRIAGDAEGGGVGSDGGGRGEGATRGEQPKAAAPKTPSADAASNRRVHRRAAARQTDTWAAADDTAQLRIGGRTGSDGHGTASDVDVSSSWWKGEIKTASSKRRPRSGSESWLLTSASMSQASGLGKIQSAKCHLWSRMEPRARGQSNPSARQNSSSELRKYSRRWDISKTPEIWDARGCARSSTPAARSSFSSLSEWPAPRRIATTTTIALCTSSTAASPTGPPGGSHQSSTLQSPRKKVKAPPPQHLAEEPRQSRPHLPTPRRRLQRHVTSRRAWAREWLPADGAARGLSLSREG